MRWWLAPVVALSVAPAMAQSDGDTISVRLWGIDAPEGAQVCADGWEAGKAATAFLRALMAGKPHSCDAPRDVDRFHRQVSVCWVDGKDLGAEMVRAGMAWAFVRYSRDYVDLEQQAKAAGLGVHGHGCIPAWEWRAQRR